MKNLFNRTLALVCAVLMMISLFALPAFADGEETTTVASEETTIPAGSEETTTPAGDEETTTAADDHDHDHDHDHEETTTAVVETATDPKGLSTAAIVWIVIGGVLVVAGVVLGIKYREKIVKALRVYKSEFKKVSWLSWKDTKKSSLIVLVVLAVCALVICLLDLGLSKGLLEMIKALRGLFA